MAAEPSYKIFIRGIAPAVDENGLELAFSKYGRIMEVLLLRDKETKASRGLGFITFECTEDCEDAVRGMNGQELKGSILQVEIATEKPGYQNNHRGRGFARGGRGGFTSRGIESSRFPARGGRPFGTATPNHHATVRGRGAFQRGRGAFESQRERFSGPADYGGGRPPYPNQDIQGECRPHMAPNIETMGYGAATTPHYSYPNRSEGPGGPEGDYKGQVAAWSRPENTSDRRPRMGHPVNAGPEYSERDQEHAYNADYDSVDRRGYEAGYGLIDHRTSEGYPPQPREERPGYSYTAQADYRGEYPDSDWNAEYSTQAAVERRPRPGQDYGMADSDRYKNAESRGYGIEDAPECGVTERDRGYGVSIGNAQQSKRSYPPPMDPYAASGDYGGQERKPDYSNPNLHRRYGGGSSVNPHEYGYGPVEEVESRDTGDWEYGPSGSALHLERGVTNTSGPQRAEYGRAEPEVVHRGYPVRQDHRRAAPGPPDSRAHGYPDPARYADWEMQEDEFAYEDRRVQRNPAPQSRSYPADPEIDTSADYAYSDQAFGQPHGRPYGAYGSASAHSEGFSGGRPARGLPRGSRSSGSGMRHPPPRVDAEEPEAKRRFAPETRGSYSESRGGRMPLRRIGRRAGRH